MNYNETNLLKWTAFVRATDNQTIGHTLNKQADEIARLRSVCRLASDYACEIRGRTLPRSLEWIMLNNLVKDLAKAGKEATDGQ